MPSRTCLAALLLSGAVCFAPMGKAQTRAPLRDCADVCPQMVAIPAGNFTMGAAPGEEESAGLPQQYRGRSAPQHAVAIAQAFAVGAYDITRDEYAAFVADTKRPDSASCVVFDGTAWKDTPARSWREPGFAQTGREPAVCVNWDDAQAYVAWLSRKTGKSYRLLSEAEWEYAARAGSQTARYGSDDPAQLCGYINGGDLDYGKVWPQDEGLNTACHDGYAYTSPAGALKPNAFGLYDMLGNVWQWTTDCWNAGYDGAPANGASWTAGDCARRVSRGGSWRNIPSFFRAAMRLGGGSGLRSNSIGFRVARSL